MLLKSKIRFYFVALVSFVVFFILSFLLSSPILASPPFESVETFTYDDGTSPAPNWSVYNFTCSGTCSPISEINNNDGTKALWSINNGHYGIHITSQALLTFTQTLPNNWPPSLNNYSVSFDINLVGGLFENRNFVVRHSIIDNWYKWYEVHLYSDEINLQKADTKYGGGLIERVYYYNFLPNTTYHFEIRIEGNNIKLFLNYNEIIDYTDESSNPILTGSAGFQSGVQSNGGDVWFDNFIVNEIPYTPTPEADKYLEVENIKQYSEPWRGLEYDTASRWSTNPTIERWGCALTSAAMVLRFFNHNILPDSLNIWLKSQADGYLRNGLVNWLAITRFSKNNLNKINSFGNLSTLEYSVISNPTTENILAVLHEDIPPIIKFLGHFVVANGEFGSDIFIKDPGSTITNLNDVITLKGPPLKLNKFTPSHTDLSYLMFVIDKNFDVKLFDSNGNLIDLILDDNNSLSDDATPPSTEQNPDLNIFLLPKPLFGEYILKVTGSGNYKLDAYIYDINGDPSTFPFTSTLNNSTNTFLMTVGENNQIVPVGFDFLLKSLDSYYKSRKINNFGVYILLRKQIEIAKYLDHQVRIYQTNRQLNLILKQIKLYTPRYISRDASSDLQKQINLLINRT